MTRAALLIALAGCNWVYGLDETKPAPDAPDAPEVVPGIPESIEFLQLTAAGAQPVDTEIADLTVEASALDGSSRAALAIEPGGLVHVPFALTMAPWRLRWQRAGGTPHEVQSPPENAHLVEPLYGPLPAMRTPPAASQGYQVTSIGYPAAQHHAVYRLFTTGVWTEGTVAGGGTMDPLTHDLTSSRSLASGPGVPRAGDKGALVDYVIMDGCRTSTGSVVFDASPSGPPEQAVSGPWSPTTDGVTVSAPLSALDTSRIAPFGESAQTPHEDVGFLASAAMPAFLRPADASLAEQRFLPGPVMLSLRRCNLPYTTAPGLNTPGDLAALLPRYAAIEVATTRKVDGVADAANGISMLAAEGANQMFAVAPRVAVASDVMLAGTSLWGGADMVALPAGAGPMALQWSRAAATGTVDFWDVALLEVSSTGGLIERRIYTTTKTELSIDRADLTAGKHYVFRFTAYVGRGAAAIGDYRTISGDQQISVVHARSFVAP